MSLELLILYQLPKVKEFETWYPFQLTDRKGENPKTYEAAIPKRGKMRVRRQRKDNEYDRFRFNNKGELVYEGVFVFDEVD